MVYLRKNLFKENNEFESPEWHKTALEETERRLKDGKVLDWGNPET